MMPIIMLKSGLRVGNFSSPHSFTFTDGSVLPGCSAERANRLMLEAIETEIPREGWIDIVLRFGMSESVFSALNEIGEDVDIVIVPLPVMQAVKDINPNFAFTSKIRTCRVADRVKKTVFADKFCL